MTDSTLINNRRKIPTYQRIEDNLRADISAGRLTDGMKLPSRRMLAEQYNVSVPTVERAIAELLIDGILRADGARGTFVAAAAVGKTKYAASHVMTQLPEPRRIQAATIGIIAAGRPALGQSSRNQWTDILTSSLERTITASGGMTRFFELNSEEREGFVHAVNTLMEEGVDALAVVLIGRQNEEVAYGLCAELPVVFLGGTKSRFPVLSVYYDSYEASVQATKHLLARGCSSLLIFAPYTINWILERVSGAQEAILQAGLPAKTLQIWIGDRELEEVLDAVPAKDNLLEHQATALEAARTLLAQHSGLPAQGVIAANDYVALGFQQAASEIGLTAGKDYALIGFDDYHVSRSANLSTMQPPMDEMGREAGRMILAALERPIPPMHVCLHSHLIARASSRLS